MEPRTAFPLEPEPDVQGNPLSVSSAVSRNPVPSARRSNGLTGCRHDGQRARLADKHVERFRAGRPEHRHAGEGGNRVPRQPHSQGSAPSGRRAVRQPRRRGAEGPDRVPTDSPDRRVHRASERWSGGTADRQSGRQTLPWSGWHKVWVKNNVIEKQADDSADSVKTGQTARWVN
jgi:hypothetical protein